MANVFASDPATDAFAVTPSDSTVLGGVRGLYVGGAGNVNLKTERGTTVLFSGVPAGAILPIRVLQVLSTSTTATNIVAFTD